MIFNIMLARALQAADAGISVDISVDSAEESSTSADPADNHALQEFVAEGIIFNEVVRVSSI